MFFLNALLFVFLATVPATEVSACEGDCIVGITNAFVGNYSAQVGQVMHQLAAEIAPLMSDQHDAAMKAIEPLGTAYAAHAYKNMETGIFPNYFHGKCLDAAGATPPGCPNPDCPIVCGTPGSLVHFWGKLRWLAFNNTLHTLKENAAPGSEAYKQVQQNVLKGAAGKKRSLRMIRRAEDDTKTKLKSAMGMIPGWLDQDCGGKANGLPQCDWEQEMKTYILTFP